MTTEKVTVEGLDKLVEQIRDKKDEVQASEEVTKNLNKELVQLQGLAVQYLKDLGRDDYKSPNGSISIEEKWRVSMPANDIEKAKLFDHLRERGIFDKYATVHSQSLNSLWKQDRQAAIDRGEISFEMPGVGAGQLFEALKFTKPRGKKA